MVSFFSLTTTSRFLISEYLNPYGERTISGRARHEILTLLPHADWRNVRTIHTMLVEDMRRGCHAKLFFAQTLKSPPGLHLSRNFRFLPYSEYSAQPIDLILDMHKVLKNDEMGVMSLFLKTLQVKNQQTYSTFWEKIVKLRTSISAMKGQQKKVKTAQMIQRYKEGASVLFRIKSFIIHAQSFLFHVAQFQMHKKVIAIMDAKLLNNSNDNEVKAFFYKWLRVIPTEEAGKIRLQSTLTAEYSQAFFNKYQNHPNPLIRQLGSFCLGELVEKIKEEYCKNACRILEHDFLCIFYMENLFFAEANYFSPQKFIKLYEAIKNTFAHVKFPLPDPVTKTLIIQKWENRFFENLPKNSSDFASIIQALDEELRDDPDIHILYSFTYKVLEELSHRSTFADTIFSEATESGNTELPHPSRLNKIYNYPAHTQSPIDDDFSPPPAKFEPTPQPSMKTNREVMPVPVVPKITLDAILSVRDFPLHDFKYDLRVHEHFQKVVKLGDWSRADWNTQSHAFALFIDRFVGTAYSLRLQEGWINKTTAHKDIQYILIADVLPQGGEPFKVTIEYTKGKDSIWYHRHMNRTPHERWDQMDYPTLEKSAQSVKGKAKSFAQHNGRMTFNPITETVHIDFNTYSIVLYRLR